MASDSYVLVQYGDACVEVSLAGIARGTQLAKAAYLELGLDKKGLALVDFRLFRTLDGERGDAILPQDTGDRLPSPCSIVEAVLAPGGACAWGWRGCNACAVRSRTPIPVRVGPGRVCDLSIVRRVSAAPRAPRWCRILAWLLWSARYDGGAQKSSRRHPPHHFRSSYR